MEKMKPCEDCISRQAAIDAIYARYIGGKEAVDKAPVSDHYAEGIDEAVCAVEDLPSVTPQQKMGRWEDFFKKDVDNPEIEIKIKAPLYNIKDFLEEVECDGVFYHAVERGLKEWEEGSARNS